VYGTFAERASSCRGWRRLAQRAGRACSNLVPATLVRTQWRDEPFPRGPDRRQPARWRGV